MPSRTCHLCPAPAVYFVMAQDAFEFGSDAMFDTCAEHVGETVLHHRTLTTGDPQDATAATATLVDNIVPGP